MSKLKKVMIVIEETGPRDPVTGNQPFDVYMAGDLEELPPEGYEDTGSAANYWGQRLMAICGRVLRETGVVKTISSIPKDN